MDLVIELVFLHIATRSDYRAKRRRQKSSSWFDSSMRILWFSKTRFRPTPEYLMNIADAKIVP
eukprot:scaffold58412_cov18-Prasinocladus_malaysianus.AAC.1